jgi:hypothetical protein
MLALPAVVLSSCLKDKPNVDLSDINPVAELTTASTSPTPQAPVSGLAYWSSAAVVLDTLQLFDTVTFTANIASDYPLNTATSITLGVDTALVSSFNASGTSTTNTYTVMPDSDYSFAVTSGTIPAGERLDTFTVIFNTSKIVNASKINDSISYMLPIQITQASNNLIISGNMGAIYFHVDATQ